MMRSYRRGALAAAPLLALAGGIAAALPASALELTLPTVAINEVESNDDTTDWIELINTGTEAVDLSGMVVKDDDDARTDAIAAGTMLAPGEFLALDALSFGLGKADTARLYLADGATLVDSYAWEAHAATTYGRCPDGTGEFVTTASSTKGAANDCGVVEEPAVEPAELSGDLAINEVESTGDDTDWVEVANLTGTDIDISGWAIKDNDDSRTDVVPAGSVVPAHGLLVIDQQSATYAEGFTFGLGNGDVFRLYDLSGELAATTTWATHAVVSWARCPDGTGEWREFCEVSDSSGEPSDVWLAGSLRT